MGKKVKPLAIIGQVAIVKAKASDGVGSSIGVWHILSNRLIVEFSPLCPVEEAGRFAELLRPIDLDTYWLGGCVDVSVRKQASDVMHQWMCVLIGCK